MLKKSTKSTRKLEKWIAARDLYIQGEQTPDGLKYPTYDELAVRFKIQPQTVRLRSCKEHWPEQRKQFLVKTQNLIQEKKSTVMAGESVEFDSECLEAARKGIKLVNKLLDTALEDVPKSLSGKDLVDYIEACNEAISRLGKALCDYQKSGRLAFGENPEPEIPINLNVKYENDK